MNTPKYDMPMSSDMQEMEESINLADYYYVLLKHKWLIFFCLIMVLSLTVFFTLQMKPVYQATGTMVIENSRSKSPVTGESIDYGGYVNQQMALNTHAKLIKSRPVLEKVIQELRMDESPADETVQINPIKALLQQIIRNIQIIMGKEQEEISPEDKENRLIGMLGDQIDIKQVRDTHLLQVSVMDNDPVRARDIANIVTSAYIEFDTAGRMRSSQDLLGWMTAQLYETQKKLEDAEAEFLAYKQKEKVFSIEGKQDVITRQIQDVNSSYLETRNLRMELDTKIAELERLSKGRKGYSGARILLENELISSLHKQLVEDEVELNRLSKVFKEKHPQIVQLAGKIDKTRAKLNEELNREMQNLRTQRKVLLKKEEMLQQNISDFENSALDTNKKELTYQILQRNVETNKKLYDTLLEKIKTSDIEENLDVSNIRIAEKAVTPAAPVKPNKKMNMVLGTVLGLMAGIGLAFLREYMDQSLRTEDDVQKYIGLPVLSVIPEAEKM